MSLGSCRRLRWFEGLRLLVCAGERGVVSGWGCGSATGARALSETLVAARVLPQPALSRAGQTLGAGYRADLGRSGEACQPRWAEHQGASVVSPPQAGSHRAWPERGTWHLARVRQVIERVVRRLRQDVRLEHERPHTLGGIPHPLAATMARHTVGMWCNRTAGQPDLALADLMEWRRSQIASHQSFPTPLETRVMYAAANWRQAPPMGVRSRVAHV